LGGFCWQAMERKPHSGAKPDVNFDRHRFDNHSAWLDLEGRKQRRSEGQHLGWGFGIPKPPQPSRSERPFYVQEPAMTSGILVNRKYDATETNFRAEKERSDPYHYPNHMDVKESGHYADHRRRNCHCDPDRWTVDPVLRDAVSDQMVIDRVRAEKGESRRPPDPKMVAILFGDNVKPQKESFKELNVDFSCLDLPHQEGGPVNSRPRPADRKSFMPIHEPPPRDMNQSAWKWCTSGRQTFADPRMDYTEEKQQMLRSQSLPQELSGASLLPGADGAPAAPFHGAATRKFGNDAGWDGRMRGSRLARNKWAGTFPEKEARFDAFR